MKEIILNEQQIDFLKELLHRDSEIYTSNTSKAIVVQIINKLEE